MREILDKEELGLYNVDKRIQISLELNFICKVRESNQLLENLCREQLLNYLCFGKLKTIFLEKKKEKT